MFFACGSLLDPNYHQPPARVAANWQEASEPDGDCGIGRNGFPNSQRSKQSLIRFPGLDRFHHLMSSFSRFPVRFAFWTPAKHCDKMPTLDQI
jgi:hypothetical protein